MKLGLLSAMFGDKSLDQTLDIIRPLGLKAIELGAGNYVGSAHLDVKALLASKSKCKALLEKLKGEGLIISALSCHGNCLHPDKSFAKANQKVQV